MGDAVIAKFGFTLGFSAAALPKLAGWVAGDEFESARKKSQAGTPVGSYLFDGLPTLRVAHYEPVHYPPLAAQTRVSGVVKLHVVVDQTGAVVGVAPLSGNPVLARGAKDNMQSRKFEPLGGGAAEFDITYEFALGEWSDYKLKEQVSFPSPQRILIETGPLVVQPTNWSKGS